MRRAVSLLALALFTACTTTPSSESPTPGASGGTAASATPRVVPTGVSAGGTAHVHAFSDTRTFDAKGLQRNLDTVGGVICSIPASDESPMSFDAAVKSVRAVLDSASPGSLAKLDASNEVKTANGWRTLAASSSGQGHLAAGVAALLEAIRLDPKDSRTLVNAAGLLPSLGLPREALAFSNEAQRLGIGEGNAMGIDPRAAYYNNVGLAYLAVRQWAKAKTALEQALQIQPGFSEAELNLGVALLCSGDRPGAAKFFRLGAYRQPLDLLEYPDGTLQPRLGSVLDESGAIEGSLPVFKYPTTVEAGIQSVPYFKGWLDLYAQRQTAHNGRRAELGAKIAATKQNALTQRRTADLKSMIYHLAAPGGLAYAAQQEVDAAVQETTDVWDSVYGPTRQLDQIAHQCAGSDPQTCFIPKCQAAMTAGHGRWLQAQDRLDRAIRAYHKVHHRYATAIAAQIGNPLEHEMAMIDIADHDDVQWDILASTAHRMTRFEQIGGPTCGFGIGSLDTEPQKTDEEADPGKCPNNLRDTKFGVKLGPLSISANCEELEIEVETEGIIGVFGQLTIGSEGEVSVFAGPKASTPTDEILPFQVSSKDGFYIQAGPDGVKDFGWAVEPIQGSAELGGHTLSVDGDKMNFSFVGISNYLPIIGTQ